MIILVRPNSKLMVHQVSVHIKGPKHFPVHNLPNLANTTSYRESTIRYDHISPPILRHSSPINRPSSPAIINSRSNHRTTHPTRLLRRFSRIRTTITIRYYNQLVNRRRLKVTSRNTNSYSALLLPTQRVNQRVIRPIYRTRRTRSVHNHPITHHTRTTKLSIRTRRSILPHHRTLIRVINLRSRPRPSPRHRRLTLKHNNRFIPRRPSQPLLRIPRTARRNRGHNLSQPQKPRRRNRTTPNSNRVSIRRNLLTNLTTPRPIIRPNSHSNKLIHARRGESTKSTETDHQITETPSDTRTVTIPAAATATISIPDSDNEFITLHVPTVDIQTVE